LFRRTGIGSRRTDGKRTESGPKLNSLEAELPPRILKP